MGSADIPEGELAHFITTVRKLSSKEPTGRNEAERTLRKIKNLSNKLFRDYIGYHPDGSYRIKPKGERCFAEAVEELGGREGAVKALGEGNPVLGRILRGDRATGSGDGSRDQDGAPTSGQAPEGPAASSGAGGAKDAELSWAQDFDPERDPLQARPAARGPERVDLDELSDDDDQLHLDFEPAPK